MRLQVRVHKLVRWLRRRRRCLPGSQSLLHVQRANGCIGRGIVVVGFVVISCRTVAVTVDARTLGRHSGSLLAIAVRANGRHLRMVVVLAVVGGCLLALLFGLHVVVLVRRCMVLVVVWVLLLLL